MNDAAGMMDQDTIMKVSQVAEYLNMAPSTVYRLARQGKLPGRKIGGAWRFSRQGIDAWINAQQTAFSESSIPLTADIAADLPTS